MVPSDRDVDRTRDRQVGAFDEKKPRGRAEILLLPEPRLRANR
jgi:hypothetical protein